MRSLKALLMLGVSASTLVQADPRDLLQEFLERDAVISQRVISKEALAVDVRGEREALLTEINGRLAREGYQLGWTQNFGIERDISEAKGWKIYPGQGFDYDTESGRVSGKGFILSQTFERSVFGDLPLIVGGSYDSINRDLAFRLNIIGDKTLVGPLVTKHWNTQVFAPEGPVEGSEVTVQFLNGAYQPLQVCARILSAGILIPKMVDGDADAGAPVDGGDASAAHAPVRDEAARSDEAAAVIQKAWRERQRVAAAHAQRLLDAAEAAHREAVRRVQGILDARTGPYRVSGAGNIVRNTTDRHNGEVVIRAKEIRTTAAEELIQRGLMT